MTKTVARILDPIVRVLEAKEPALAGFAVTALAALGGRYGLHLSAQQEAIEVTVVSGVVSAVVRQLVHATGVAPLETET
jgi:hypothetical protein